MFAALSPAEYTEGMRQRKVPEAHKDARGAGVRVAVLDTGCDLVHSEFEGAIRAHANFTDAPDVSDNQGHGTHVAGTIGARENDKGVLGVAPDCELLIGKVLGDDGSGYGEWIAAGIDWAVQNGAHLISMSLGSAFEDREITGAIVRAVKSGVWCICAAGNDGRPNSVNWPAKHPAAIAVGATDDRGRVAEFSSRGKQVDVAAPGVNILSAWPGGKFARISGTSMATPFVTGCIALALSDDVALDSVADLRTLFERTSEDVGDPGHDSDYGWGLINPDTMLDTGDGAPPVEPAPPEWDGDVIDFGLVEIAFPARSGDFASVSFGDPAMADQFQKMVRQSQS